MVALLFPNGFNDNRWLYAVEGAFLQVLLKIVKWEAARQIDSVSLLPLEITS
jgi:hypothetical protein